MHCEIVRGTDEGQGGVTQHGKAAIDWFAVCLLSENGVKKR